MKVLHLPLNIINCNHSSCLSKCFVRCLQSPKHQPIDVTL
ncbi:hypothetical protein SLEP1_g28166 [Rubroshorea leprosula]|uniref:Uncharacterized protein n=1 Tax=Rubroshorea leprosula TaxID=152421 RepID=A0AAV5JVE2_9ROSI|nr:hypothetical protein SLEP1_g28166 [Rubroshorea leprosula]